MWQEPSLPISTDVTTNDAGPLWAGRSRRFRSDEKQILHTARKVRERVRDGQLGESSRRRGRAVAAGNEQREGREFARTVRTDRRNCGVVFVFQMRTAKKRLKILLTAKGDSHDNSVAPGTLPSPRSTFPRLISYPRAA